MKEKYNTIEYYKKNAKSYCEQTFSVNLQENYDRFVCQLPKNAYILDFGCGSGRDSKYFIDNGYRVEATDGSSEMCKFASKYINQEVKCMKFDELKDIDMFDGIWACSSVLHVEKDILPSVLHKMINALKVNGVIYASFKTGAGYEIKEGKYYNFLTREEMEECLSETGENVKIIDYFETLSSTKRDAQNTIWGNFIIKKF